MDPAVRESSGDGPQRAALRLPRLGFGAAALGNLFSPLEDQVARATVDAAWDAGVRHFDVAPHYGLGLAERRLGQALAGRRREEYVLSTKAGRLLRPSPSTAHLTDDMGFAVPADVRRVWDASEHGLRTSLTESIERMGIGQVDILYLHDPEEHVPPGQTLESVLAESLPALAQIRNEGLVRAVGVGSKSVDGLLAAVRSGHVDVIMLAGRYTLLEQPALAALLPACSSQGVQVVAVGVYNSGALSEPTPRRDLPYEYGPMPPTVYERLRLLADLCNQHGTDLPTAALHFPLRHPAVSSIVVGARTPEQVVQNVARLADSVPESLWADLESAGLTAVDRG